MERRKKECLLISCYRETNGIEEMEETEKREVKGIYMSRQNWTAQRTR